MYKKIKDADNDRINNVVNSIGNFNLISLVHNDCKQLTFPSEKTKVWSMSMVAWNSNDMKYMLN